MEAAVRRVLDTERRTGRTPQHEELFRLYLGLVSEIQANVVKSEEKWRQSRIWGRGLVAVSSLAATLAGLGLVFDYHNPGSRAFGIAVAVIGIWTTISTALGLDAEYGRNVRRNRSYRRLLRELELYMVSTFPDVTAEQAATRFAKFSREYENIGDAERERSDGN